MTGVEAPEQSATGGLPRRRPSGEPPPLPHELDRVAVGWLVTFLGWVALWGWVFLSDDPKVWITEFDLELMNPFVDRRNRLLTAIFEPTNQIVIPWLTISLGWVTVLGGLAARRIRHVLVFFAALSINAALATHVGNRIGRPRPLGFERIGDWEGFSQPSRPLALLAVVLVACGLTLVPRGNPRRWWIRAMAVTLVLAALAQVYVAVDHPTDVLVGGTMGIAITLTGFRTIAPERVFPIRYHGGKTAHLDVSGPRGEAIRRALSGQLGVDSVRIEPVGLAGSAGSTPLRIVRDDGPDLFAKLYASTHLRSDRSYKLGRALLYGRLEDEQRFTSVRRLIQHEHYMLYAMGRAGIPTIEPLGIVEITPHREYLLVTEYLSRASDIAGVEVTPDLIDQGLAAVRAMWDGGLAHRDIKPANLMVQDGRLRVIDVGFGEIRPSPWRQAVDLANMMLVLALGSDPELVYERALRWFSPEEISEAFAASRGVTLPSALRAEVRRDGRRLLQRFRELAPPRRPVWIQRWSMRRVGLLAWVGVVTLLMTGVVLSSLPDIGLWP